MKEKIALISVSVNTVLAVGKIAIGSIFHSVAILADGLHSFMDIFSSIIGFLGIKISRKPGDEEHPYGHYKFEVLAGLFITLILVGTGMIIIYEAYQRWLNPLSIKVPPLAFLVMIFSAIINEIMARLKIYFGKKENSMALLSDGFHSRIDVFSSLGVFIGLFFVKYWLYADSFLAFLIGFYVIKKSFSLGKEAVDSLLDVSAGKEIEEKIKSIAESQNIKVSSLKTQKKGSVITANLETELPPDLSVERATKISETLRKALIKEIKTLVYVTIQVKSHQAETGFYKPDFGRAFGWRRQGRFVGFCVCPHCGYKVKHQRGIPCSSLQCPHCKVSLVRLER